MSNSRLDALLSEVRAPPAPAGLTERVAAAAIAVPQEARPVQARRAAGRDRRGAWLRRPLIGGAVALGLAFSGAVAATLAGVPLPAKVAAVIAQIPFVGHKYAEPEHAPVRHAEARPTPHPVPTAPPPAEVASAEPPYPDMGQRPAAIRRMILAQRIVARREAMGLPAPAPQQLARMIHRRQMMQRWQRATPEERQAFAASHPRAAAMLEGRMARRDANPQQREAFLAAHPQAGAGMGQRQALRGATPEQREAFFAAHPEARARMEQQRQALRDATPEQREAFFAAHPQARARMEQRQALMSATPEQREAFFAAHPRARAMMEARRARRQGMAEPQ